MVKENFRQTPLIRFTFPWFLGIDSISLLFKRRFILPRATKEKRNRKKRTWASRLRVAFMRCSNYIDRKMCFELCMWKHILLFPVITTNARNFIIIRRTTERVRLNTDLHFRYNNNSIVLLVHPVICSF